MRAGHASATLGVAALALALAGHTARAEGQQPGPAKPATGKPHASPPRPTPSRPARPGKPKARGEPPLPKGYAGTVRAWHTPTPGKTPEVDGRGRPRLVLRAIGSGEQAALTALTERGGFGASDLEHAARVLRDPRTGNEHPVEPRLLDSVYRIATHFSAHEVRVVSGYRTPKPGGTSNHGRGRAMDLVIPGATDEDVAKFAREAGFSGVGVYPVSGFVHVDVRGRSYFWVDTSGPGRRSRLRGVLGDVAARADAAALGRGERPVTPFTLMPDVDAALRAHGTHVADPSQHEEDEDLEPGADG